MGFSEAVQWWEDWQLRILVLTSLFLQCFLFFAGILRKRCIPSWLRFFIWLAYLGSDAVAIYALATLFNRNKEQGWVTTRSTTNLEVLWAPILLVHLGGQDGITAYNIEDNELWRRHVLTAVSQVAVAVYVFCKSWSGDRKFLSGPVLLFVAGILKCVLKPWDLKRVSINSLVGSSVSSGENRDTISSLDGYVRAATEQFREGHGGQPSGSAQEEGGEAEWVSAILEDEKVWKPYDLFVDLAPPYRDRLRRLKALVHDPELAHELVQDGLALAFDRLYTKETLLWHPKRSSRLSRPPLPNSTKLVGMIISYLRFLVTGGSVASAITGLQSNIMSRWEAYDHTYVIITYTLLGLTVVLELFLPMFVISFWERQFHNGKPRWPDQVAQHNLIGYLARNKNHRKLMRLATLLLCRDYIDQLWCMKPSKSSADITYLVHSYVAQAWTERRIQDTATYRAFNDNRGQWSLGRGNCRDLEWSVQRPFDESVILWHLATDFCFHDHLVTAPSSPTSTSHKAANLCREMSNYMAYLLLVNPEMLMTGARRSLFRAAYKQLKKTLNVIPQPDAEGPSRQNTPREEGEFAQKIALNIQHARGRVDLGIVHDAWKLARGLEDLRMQEGDATMWRVIQRVWVEMLCFSAGRCRGYLHAKSLGKGGEYLSYIWLLLSYMGMENLTEKMQRANVTTMASPVTATGGGGDGITVASPVRATDGASDGIAEASPVMATDGAGHGTTIASPVTSNAGGSAIGITGASPAMPTGGSADDVASASPVTPNADENV